MKGKGPRIIAIYPEPDYGDRDPDDSYSFHVLITLKQLRKLPRWVQEQIHWMYGTDSRHCVVVIGAEDELQASIRFNKLWAGLPKED
jgi:hypothetical protein